MLERIKCKHCEMEFQPRNRQHVFCSKKCQRKHHYILTRTVRKDEVAQCVVCKKEYLAKHSRQKYCSRNCKDKAKYRRNNSVKIGAECVCPTCGRQFEATGTRHVFCSHECQFSFKEIHKKTRVCLTCGKEFEARNGLHIYCTEDCRLFRPHEVTCVVCGKTFETKGTDLTIHKACSLMCRKQASRAGRAKFYAEKKKQKEALRISDLFTLDFAEMETMNHEHRSWLCSEFMPMEYCAI